MFNRRYFLSGVVAATIATSLPVQASIEPVDKFARLPNEIADILRQGEDVLRSKVFDFNDAITRENVRAEMASVFDRAITTRRLYQARVVCDETNNYASIIDGNMLVQTLYIQPMNTTHFYSFRQTFGPNGVETINSVWNDYPELRLRRPSNVSWPFNES